MTIVALIGIGAIPIIVIILIVLTIILIVRRNKGKKNQLKYSQYQDKYRKWENVGYDLSELNNGLKQINNLDETVVLFSNFEEKIKKTLEFESKIEDLNFNFSTEEKQKLDYLLKQPTKIKEVEDLLNNYQVNKENIIRKQREKIKILSDKVRENAKDLFDKTIDIGDTGLTEVISVLLDNLKTTINSYQLEDSSFEKTESELNRMLDNIEKLSKGTTETGNQSKSRKTTGKKRTAYDILKVKPDASLYHIKIMRNALVKIFINDDEELKNVNNAYDVLKDPSKRKKYNNKHNI